MRVHAVRVAAGRVRAAPKAVLGRMAVRTTQPAVLPSALSAALSAALSGALPSALSSALSAALSAAEALLLKKARRRRMKSFPAGQNGVFLGAQRVSRR